MKVEARPQQNNYLAPIQEKVIENDKNLQNYVDFIAASKLSLNFDKSVTAENLQLEKDNLFKQMGFSVKAEVEFEFKASGNIQSMANRAIQAEFRAEFKFEFSLKINSGQKLERQDPLVLDLDRDGEFSFSDVSSGKVFDINADGRLDKTNFVTGLDAFLAIDLNGNGRIDSGKELFGDQNGAENGFGELSKYDEDGNGVIDKDDKVYRDLLAFGSDFLTPLDGLGVTSISLDYKTRNQDISDEVTLTDKSTAQSDFGEVGVADALVSFRTIA